MPVPWEDEPDIYEFISDEGYPCVICRGGYGNLCGYIGVSDEHVFYEKKERELTELKVYGNITYTGKKRPVSINKEKEDPYSQRKDGMLFSIGEATEDGNWWLGFDAATEDDLLMTDFTPEGKQIDVNKKGTYKTFSFIYKEIEALSRQLKDIENSRARICKEHYPLMYNSSTKEVECQTCGVKFIIKQPQERA